jgi:hypothetical protein
MMVHVSQEEQTMLDYTLDAENSILFIRPKSSLSEGDFVRLVVAGGDLVLVLGFDDRVRAFVPRHTRCLQTVRSKQRTQSAS